MFVRVFLNWLLHYVLSKIPYFNMLSGVWLLHAYSTLPHPYSLSPVQASQRQYHENFVVLRDDRFWLKHTWTIQASYGFLILFNSNNIIEDIPKNITIASMILDEVINKGILLSRVFEVPKTKPQVMENNERLILFPTSLLVDNIVDASDKSFCSTSVNTKRLFGDENKPCPIPWRTHAIKRT